MFSHINMNSSRMAGMSPGLPGMNFGFGGMNPGMGFMVIEDINGWNLIFENSDDKHCVNIRINEQKLVKEAISMYFIKSGREDKCKFIYNNKELFPEMKINKSGLNNMSKIIVVPVSFD